MRKSIPFTQAGLEKMQAEKGTLEQSRPAAVAELTRTRDMGDRSENGAYKAARARLSSIDANLRRLNHVLRNAVVVAPPPIDRIGIGSHVLLQKPSGERVEYDIVGGYESDVNAGKISHHSPVGRSLMGRRQHDIISLQTPAGTVAYEVITIS